MIYISGLAIGWLIAKFEPLHWFIDYAFINFAPQSKLMEYIHSSFGCWKCTSFWITLMISGNIVTAAIVSMVAYILSQWIEE